MLLSVSQVIESGVLPRDVDKFRILRCISANLVKSGGALRFGLIETNRGPAYKVEVSQVYFGSLSLLLRFREVSEFVETLGSLSEEVERYIFETNVRCDGVNIARLDKRIQVPCMIVCVGVWVCGSGCVFVGCLRSVLFRIDFVTFLRQFSSTCFKRSTS